MTVINHKIEVKAKNQMYIEIARLWLVTTAEDVQEVTNGLSAMERFMQESQLDQPWNIIWEILIREGLFEIESVVVESIANNGDCWSQMYFAEGISVDIDTKTKAEL